VLALALLGGGGLRAGGEPAVERRLHYSLRVWKGLRALGTTVGSVTVEHGRGSYRQRPCRLLRVRTRAGVLGLRVDATTESHFAADDGRELGFHYLRTGSRRVESRLLFLPEGIEYHKRLAPRGSREQVWERQARHRYQRGVCDMFAAFYLARVEGLAVGGPPRTMRCVADRKLWDVAFRAVGRSRVTVPAGTFDTLCLAIEPTAANDHTKPLRFRGPFALGATTRFWVDPRAKALVKLVGTAHLAIPVRAEMRLLRIDQAAAPGARGQ